MRKKINRFCALLFTYHLFISCNPVNNSNNQDTTAPESIETPNQLDSIITDDAVVSYCNKVLESRMYGDFEEIKEKLHPLEWVAFRLQFDMPETVPIRSVIDRLDSELDKTQINQIIKEQDMTWLITNFFGTLASESSLNYIYECQRVGEDKESKVTSKAILVASVKKNGKILILNLPIDKYHKIKSKLPNHFGTSILPTLDRAYSKIHTRIKNIDKYVTTNSDETEIIRSFKNFRSAIFSKNNNTFSHNIYPGLVWYTNELTGRSETATEIARYMQDAMTDPEIIELAQKGGTSVISLTKITDIRPTTYSMLYREIYYDDDLVIESPGSAIFIQKKNKEGWFLFEYDAESIEDILSYEFSSEEIDRIVRAARY